MGCPTKVRLEDSCVFSICCHDPDTGVLTDADSVPTYRVYENETEIPVYGGNMAKLDDTNSTGFYTSKIACTRRNGFEVSKSYNIYIEATIDGDTGGISYAFRILPPYGRTPLSMSLKDKSLSIGINFKV